MGSMKYILKCERISRIDVVVYQSMFAVMRKNEKMKTKEKYANVKTFICSLNWRKNK